jgi:hypothetical protein
MNSNGRSRVADFTKGQVREMHRLYTKELWPLKVVGAQYGISGETLRGLFNEYSFPVRVPGISSATIRNLERAESRHNAIIRRYKTVGSISEVAAEFEIPEHYVSTIVSTLSSRQNYRRRNITPSYTDEDLLEALVRAADVIGEPLQVHRYKEVVPKLKLPSHMTIINRFGSWSKACRKAGVRPGKSRVTRAQRFSQEDCVVALRACRDQLGHRPTYDEYHAWAKGVKHRPSGPTVRGKFNPRRWTTAAKEAFGG